MGGYSDGGGLMSMIASMFGGAGDVGTTPIEQGVGYSPEIPMSTGVDTGFNVPAQPTDASAGVSPSFWQQLTSFLGQDGGTNGTPDGQEVDPTTGKPTGKQSHIADFGKFLQSAQGVQTSLQNSKLAQQMLQQHLNQPKQQKAYEKPQDMATRMLMAQGLLQEGDHMDKTETPPTPHEVSRYAIDQLHSIRPQPPAIIIADILSELKSKLSTPAEHEPPPKDLDEALSRIEAKLGKLDPPLKNKPDFKAVLEAAHAAPPPPVEAVDAPSEPSGKPAEHPASSSGPSPTEQKNKKAS